MWEHLHQNWVGYALLVVLLIVIGGLIYKALSGGPSEASRVHPDATKAVTRRQRERKKRG